MDVSKRGEEMLVSGSDDGYIGVSIAMHMIKGTADMKYRSGTREPKTP